MQHERKKKRKNPCITKWLLAWKQKQFKSHSYCCESSWSLTKLFCFKGKIYIFVLKCCGLDGSQYGSYDEIFLGGLMYDIRSSVKLPHPSSLLKVCSHWQRRAHGYSKLRIDCFPKGAKAVNVFKSECGPEVTDPPSLYCTHTQKPTLQGSPPQPRNLQPTEEHWSLKHTHDACTTFSFVCIQA